VLRGLGKQQSLWDIDTLDWERPGADRIHRRVVQDARSGSVVLAHDGGGVRTQTVAALPRILETLKKRGYRFGALCG
jgi:peptidoglycan/xylan/chitin deacetylase (PgdA/CDA1 family)